MTRNTADELWIDMLVVELRVRRVSGPAIGDTIASVREFLADSGQSAEEAFGTARAYAASLALPSAESRGHRAVRVVLLPVLGLFAFLVFAFAGTAWVGGEPVMLSLPQAALLSVPVLLTLLMTWPFALRSVRGQSWLPVLLVLLAGASGALSALVAPSSAAEAWAVLPAGVVLAVAGSCLVVLSVVATVLTLRGRDTDEITEPLAGPRASTRGRRLAGLLVVDWLFPILAVLVLGLAALLSGLAR